MRWCVSYRADPVAAKLADRHYNRQKIGSPQFVPPGSCCVFLTDCGRAFWVTSAPKAEYVKHAWAGAWVCSAFRSEGAGRASELIRQAVAATLWHYRGVPVPSLGMVTMINRDKVRPTKVRGKKVWGWTWLKAGFHYAGQTKGGLLVFQLLPHEMPLLCAPQPFRTTAVTSLSRKPYQFLSEPSNLEREMGHLTVAVRRLTATIGVMSGPP